MGKSCSTCKKMLFKNLCPRSECLKNGYRDYEEGDPQAERLIAEREGRVNIVIGGQGEAEVNANWTMDEAYKHLDGIAEECGFLVISDPAQGTIGVFSHGQFVLRFKDDCLERITEIVEKPIWPKV